MKLTSEYPHYTCPFGTFNKAQEVAVPFLDQDVNLVVSFPTAGGKTVLAECAFAYHLKTCKDSKVVYVSPLRSLSAERYDDWCANEQFSPYGVLLSTGDALASKEDFEKHRMLILTNESFDAKTRNQTHHEWLRDTACVAFDEAHLLGQDGRGDSLEVSLVRFTRINPDARLIFLSATMENVAEISEWVKSLNGKRTIKVKSKWRPTKLKTKLHKLVVEEGDKSQAVKARKVREILMAIPSYEKVLVFVHSKSFGTDLAKMLRREGIACEFHNASLSRANREKIEKAFNDPDSGLNVLVSTSTLSAGVNIG